MNLRGRPTRLLYAQKGGARVAHSDYNCCAICDRKLEYAGFNATTKERICESCLVELQTRKLPIVTVAQFIDWVKGIDKDMLRSTLKDLGFRRCYYSNDVDDAVRAAGIEFDDRRAVQ